MRTTLLLSRGSISGSPRQTAVALPLPGMVAVAQRSPRSGRWGGSALITRAASPGRPALSGAGGRECVRVELEQVVGGGDQPPFRAGGGSAAALEALDPAVELRVGEHRLDHDVGAAVKGGRPGGRRAPGR